MKVNAQFKYLGFETATTREGKTFHQIGLLQGLKSDTIFVDSEMLHLVKDMPPMTDVEVALNIYSRKDGSMGVQLEDIYPLAVNKKVG